MDPALTAALDAAFYLSFKFVVSTGKRLLLCLDVSGSMDSKSMGSVLSLREACSALVMASMRTEPQCQVMAFHQELVPLALTKDMSLDAVLEYTRGMPFGATDCSLPMEWAYERGLLIDAFVVFTDCETNCNRLPPAMALQKYRTGSGVDARLVVVATSATEFTLADPADGGMLDVAGMDSSMPQIISEFIRGDL